MVLSGILAATAVVFWVAVRGTTVAAAWIVVVAYILGIVIVIINTLLVIWELLIAIRTREHFWLQYVLFAASVAIGILVVLTAPFLYGHNCGCAA
jgi:hypothetical protein